MEIILIRRFRGAQGPIRVRGAGLALLTAAALGFSGAIAYGGYQAGRSAALDGARSEPALERQLARQEAVVEQAIREAKENLHALALRLGELQAHVTRLDALGARLVDRASLDATEFEFDSPPARGGPHYPAAVEQSVPDFLAALEALSQHLEDREPKLDVLERLLMTERLSAEVQPEGRPVRKGWMSSGFGNRTDPLTGRRAFHSGLDFAGPPGTEVIAVAAGVIVDSSYDPGLGNLVEINHGGGIVTRYAHNRKNLVEVGDTVKKGQAIALLGATGRVTGPHVHFEVLRDGKPVNPLRYVQAAP